MKIRTVLPQIITTITTVVINLHLNVSHVKGAKAAMIFFFYYNYKSFLSFVKSRISQVCRLNVINKYTLVRLIMIVRSQLTTIQIKKNSQQLISCCLSAGSLFVVKHDK